MTDIGSSRLTPPRDVVEHVGRLPRKIGPGTRIGSHCRVLRVLEAGPRVAILECVSRRLGRPVVVKLSRRLVTDHERAAELFFDEAAVLAHLRHPRVPCFRGCGLHDGQPYLILDHVDGVPLHRHAVARRFGVRDPDVHRRFVLRQLTQILLDVHAASVFHRDVKPANVLVSAGGEVHLIDWALAHAPQLLPGAGLRRSRTPRYAPPERLAGRPFSGAADDAFSLGMLGLELLLGWPAARIRVERPGRLRRVARDAVDADVADAFVDLVHAAPAIRPDGIRRLDCALGAFGVPGLDRR